MLHVKLLMTNEAADTQAAKPGFLLMVNYMNNKIAVNSHCRFIGTCLRYFRSTI